jgi:hypothetical protein
VEVVALDLRLLALLPVQDACLDQLLLQVPPLMVAGMVVLVVGCSYAAAAGWAPLTVSWGRERRLVLTGHRCVVDDLVAGPSRPGHLLLGDGWLLWAG